MTRVALVTGASSGIGALAADRLRARGWRVFAASRRGSAPAGCDGVVMDVDRDDSVVEGIARIIAVAGRIDAVVACAGWGIAGAIEDTSPAEAKAQLETNFFGAHRVVHSAPPQLRRQGSGRIVLVSSLAASIPLPYQALDRKSTRLNSSHIQKSRMPSSA